VADDFVLAPKEDSTIQMKTFQEQVKEEREENEKNNNRG